MPQWPISHSFFICFARLASIFLRWKMHSSWELPSRSLIIQSAADSASLHILQFKELVKINSCAHFLPIQTTSSVKKNKLKQIVCIHFMLMRKSSLTYVARMESHTCKSSETRRSVTAADTEGQCPVVISWNWINHDSINLSPVWFYLWWKKIRKREKERTIKLAPSVKYNTTQAVLHMERCQTRLPHQAMTSYIRTCQFAPHLSGFSYATNIQANTKYGWPQNSLT